MIRISSRDGFGNSEKKFFGRDICVREKVTGKISRELI